jgi:hypothetical protein
MFGSFIGDLLAGLIKAPFDLIESITGIKPIGEIGELLGNAARRSINTASIAIDGSVDVISGVITSDCKQLDRGLSKVGRAGERVIDGAINTAAYTLKSVGDVFSGDELRIKKGMENLLKVGAVAAIGTASVFAIDMNIDFNADMEDVSQEVHHVRPHTVPDYTREDGTPVHGYPRGGELGYLRTNPDSTTDNNLS